MHRLPYHPFVLPIGKVRNSPQRQATVVAMSDSAVQNENDTAMSQNPRFLHRQLEIVQLLEAEFSDYSCLEERFREMSDSRRELEEQLSAKDEDVIRWKTAYTQCYSKLCQLLEKNWQADEECQQLREECQQLREECQQLSEENMVLSYLSEVMSSFFLRYQFMLINQTREQAAQFILTILLTKIDRLMY